VTGTHITFDSFVIGLFNYAVSANRVIWA